MGYQAVSVGKVSEDGCVLSLQLGEACCHLFDLIEELGSFEALHLGAAVVAGGLAGLEGVCVVHVLIVDSLGPELKGLYITDIVTLGLSRSPYVAPIN